MPVRIIEKESAFHVGQRGAGLQPRTLELFSFLGVLPDIFRNGSYMAKHCIYDMTDGRKPAKILDRSPYEEPTPSVPYVSFASNLCLFAYKFDCVQSNPWMIGQDHTEEILRSHLAKYNIQVELNTELVSFEQNTDTVTVNVIKRDGVQEKVETASVDWLVGTDGGRSESPLRLHYPNVELTFFRHCA